MNSRMRSRFCSSEGDSSLTYWVPAVFFRVLAKVFYILKSEACSLETPHRRWQSRAGGLSGGHFHGPAPAGPQAGDRVVPETLSAPGCYTRVKI